MEVSNVGSLLEVLQSLYLLETLPLKKRKQKSCMIKLGIACNLFRSRLPEVQFVSISVVIIFTELEYAAQSKFQPVSKVHICFLWAIKSIYVWVLQQASFA